MFSGRTLPAVTKVTDFRFSPFPAIILFMRLGFTDTLAVALLHADEQARKFGHDFVGTEHLLMGILIGKSGDAFRSLQAETNVEQLLPELISALPEGGTHAAITGRLPLSPKAQRVVNTAISEAQAAGQSAVSTRFLLLALLGESDSAVSEILTDSGADLDELQGLLSRPNGNAEH
jgi:ATP-dependent Clp protease ATP-binding subunit ClpC